MPGRCYKCKVIAGTLRNQSCWSRCVYKEVNAEEAARLRDFEIIKPDGVDYTETDHPRFKRIEGGREDWTPMPGWADIVAGKCKCKQCEQARFAHTVKQMVAEETKKAKDKRRIRRSLCSDTSNFPRWI